MAEKTISTGSTVKDQAGGVLDATQNEGIMPRRPEDKIIARETPPELPPDASTDVHVRWSEKHQAAVEMDKKGRVIRVLPREKPL